MKILLALNPVKPCIAALQFAVDMAKNKNSLVSAVFVHDYSFLYLTGSMGIEPQPYEMAYTLTEDIQQEISVQLKNTAAVVEHACKQAGIIYNLHIDSGIAVNEVVRRSAFADIMVMGKNAVSSTGAATETDIMEDILTSADCPTIIIPDEAERHTNVSFIYDGSAESMLAIRQFTCLLAHTYAAAAKNAYILHADENEENIKLLKEYCALYYTDLHYHLVEDETDTLQQLAKQPSQMLVTAMHSRPMLARLFGTSRFTHMINDMRSAVFEGHI